ncbi:unnamed protein product, partial [Rotaria sp. Silwood2]
YYNKNLFKTKQWVSICIVCQWIFGALMTLPILLGVQPYCITSQWVEIYKLIFIVIVPSIVFLIVNILIYITILSSSHRVRPRSISITENNSANVRQERISRRDIHLLRHMILMFSIFVGGWTPLYALFAIQSQVFANTILSQCFTIWCQLAFLCDIIDLYFVFLLAFLASISLALLILGCALTQYNWWPTFMIIFYVLCPIPLAIGRRCTSDSYSMRDSSSCTDLMWLITSVIVISAFDLPAVMCRAAVCEDISIRMSNSLDDGHIRHEFRSILNILIHFSFSLTQLVTVLAILGLLIALIVTQTCAYRFGIGFWSFPFLLISPLSIWLVIWRRSSISCLIIDQIGFVCSTSSLNSSYVILNSSFIGIAGLFKLFNYGEVILLYILFRNNDQTSTIFIEEYYERDHSFISDAKNINVWRS